MSVSAERRSKPRRRARKFFGSPPAEHNQIDLADDDVVRYWAEELAVSTESLKSAAQAVGPTVKALREHFGK